MIISENKNPSVSTLTGEQQQFRIATNAKAFRVLVDGIYADKIGSIVRELLSNAYDAHIRRGTLDVPFEVRLPNGLNPTFSVRDDGCSMDHEFVMTSYSTLFESSKSNSNDEVGCFGLGAKSFLAYTDACTLTCWSDGEVRAYSIVVGDNGVPEVRLVHRAPSDEPQGVEVTFAVHQHDFRKFAEAAEHCALGYDVLPKFVGSEVTVPTPLHSGDGWRIYDQRLNDNDGTVMLRQGCAVYPVGRYSLRSTIPYGWTLIVDCPIGSANVTASREAVALTTDQQAQLQTLVNASVEALAEQVRAEYATLSTDIARARFATENLSLLGAGNWPTFVRTPWSVNKWDMGAVVPYDTFSVNTLPKMLVVHDDGTKVPRRQMRLRALAKSGKTVYIETDAARIREIVKILDLEPRQVMKIERIPDVTVNRTAGGTAAPKKKITAGAVWALANRNDASAGVLGWNRSKSSIGGFNGSALHWINQQVAAVSNEPVLFLTEREAEKALAQGKISESMRLDVVLSTALDSIEDEQFIGAAVDSGIRHRIYQDYVRTAMLRRAECVRSPLAEAVRPVMLELNPSRLRRIEVRANEIISDLAAKYPLLWGYDADAAERYIAMCEGALRVGQAV